MIGNVPNRGVDLSCIQGGHSDPAVALRRQADSDSDEGFGCNVSSWWWLRSPGNAGSRAANVNNDGWLNRDGNNVNNSTGGVRPASLRFQGLMSKAEPCQSTPDARNGNPRGAVSASKQRNQIPIHLSSLACSKLAMSQMDEHRLTVMTTCGAAGDFSDPQDSLSSVAGAAHLPTRPVRSS